MRRLEHARILMYSHDTFGLGHLRRCRTIANALVERFKGVQVLIISGSPIAGAFDFRARVDFVKIPSVIKLYNGEYTSIDQHIDLQGTLAMRQSIIRHTAETFQPDFLIVDKEPMGLRGELEDTLAYLKTHGTELILGLRDVMDSPTLLQAEWQKRDMMKKIAAYFDRIWIYGPESFWNPLQGFEVPEAVENRMDFVGFLHRTMPQAGVVPETDDRLLVTTGGGGDGAELFGQVLEAFQAAGRVPAPTTMVLGPFMPSEERETIRARAAAFGDIEILDFDNRPEFLINSAAALVSMGGYNTFCEILSFDKRALIVPRVIPREEQLIRATRARELGLIDMMLPNEADDPAALYAALEAVLARPKPSECGVDMPLDGLDRIAAHISGWPEQRKRARLTVVERAH